MRGAGVPWIHELLLSAMKLFHKNLSLSSSSTPHNVESSRVSGEQETAQSASECPRKRSLTWGVFLAKVQETHAWRNARLRSVCTLGEAVKKVGIPCPLQASYCCRLWHARVEDANMYVHFEPFES